MPFDANGNYTLPTIYIAIPGEVIKSTQHNTPFEDVQTALNNTLCRDGRTPWTGNQNANNNKLTGLAKGTNSTDAVRMDQAATLDGETDFTGRVTVQDVDDWASNEPVPAKQADSRYLKIASGRLKTDTAVNALWVDLTTEPGLPRFGFAGANGTTYSAYGVDKVNALIGGCIQNTNPGLAGALAGTSLCVKPNADADGRDLPYLAYDGNTKIVALARDDSKLDISGGQVNYLRVGTYVHVLGNQCAVYNSGAGAWVNTYVDNSGNATWDLNGGSPDNNTGNRSWLRMAPDGHLQTGKGPVAFLEDISITSPDENTLIQHFSVGSTPTMARIKFPIRFGGIPRVLVNATQPPGGTTVLPVNPGGVDAAGFTAVIWSGNTAWGLDIIAIGPKA